MKPNSSFFQRAFTWSLLFILFLFFINNPVYFDWFIIFALLEILVFEWKNFFKINDFRFWLLSFFYLILPFTLIIWLNNALYRVLLASVFVLIFSFDTGAYVIGKLFGKNKIAPKISPGKTWEGLFGGYLTCLITTNLILLYLNKSNFIFSIVFSLAVAVLAFFGDLFESYLKRRANIKDSGSLLPGHGGFLDRFDSIIPVVMFVYLFKEILIKYF